MNIWHYIIMWAEVVLATGLLYFRFCLYESEEGRLQSALAEVWIRTADRSESTRERFARLLAESARLSARFFDLLLGPRLLSLRAISTYGFLILVSGTMTNAIIKLIHPDIPNNFTQKLTSFTGTAAVLLIFFYVALAPVTIRRRWGKAVPVAVFVLIQIIFVFLHQYSPLASFWAVIALDYLWLLIVRRQIELALRSASKWRHVLILIGGLSVSVACFVVFPGKYHPGLISDEWLWSQSEFVIGTSFGLSDSRFCIAAVSLIQVSVIAFGFLNWMVWSFLSRLIYAAERYEFFRQRKWFATLGIALLVHAASGGGWIKTMVEAVGKSVSG
jgi:hypothetical protein